MKKIDRYYTLVVVALLAVVGYRSLPAIAEWSHEEQVIVRPEEIVNDGEWYVVSGDYDTAQRLYEKALRANPENLNALRAMGRLYHAKGEYDTAEEYLKRVLEVKPHDRGVWAHLGLTYMEAERYEDAIAAFRKALEAAPNVLVPPYRLIAQAYVKLGDEDAALAALEEGISKRPDFETHFRDLLTTKRYELEGEGEDHGVRDELTGLLARESLAPELGAFDGDLVIETIEREQIARLHFEAGSILSRRAGCARQAIEHYNQAIAMDSRYGEAYNNRALMHYKVG